MKKLIAIAILAVCSAIYLAGCGDDREKADLVQEVQDTAVDAGETDLTQLTEEEASGDTQGLNLADLKKSTAPSSD